MLQGISESLQHDIERVIREHIDLTTHTAFFFGSRVTGTARDTSDIDVGITGEPIPLGTLGKLRNALDSLHTLYTIDVVDVSGASSDFKEVALAHTIPIPSQNHVKT